MMTSIKNGHIKILAINLLILSLFACSNSNGNIEIAIQDYGNDISTLSPNAAIYKAKDVDFFKGNLGGTTIYSCIMYPFNTDTIQPLIGYQIYTKIENNYDTATFKWINDSTLTFRLKNSYLKSKTYTVIGHGNTTSLYWDDL